MATVKKKSAKKAPKMQSFKISKSPKSFMSLEITRQTVYWTILVGLIFALSLWVLNIQIDTMRVLDSLNSL
ncbi:MAG: hypothetical protein WCI79_02670 [Candidatus Saccharibacteria bacterium]